MSSIVFPHLFGPYTLERFIAAGGMAEVFLATRDDGAFPGPICVKRMLPEMMKSADYVTMFRDEAALSMRLVHPNIVRVLDCGQADGAMYMAMEYVDGLDVGSLHRRLKQRQESLGVAHALQIGVELCAGLHYAHTLLDERRRPLKLIHRDVSPQNILISSAGQVKITDFGIAKAVGRETHTQTGLIKGKISYMAPEQALGQYIDQRLDQFAAGIVIWEMLTGQRLYQAPSELLTFEKIIRQAPPRPSTVRAGIPSSVDQVVLRALQKSPDERYPDLNAFGAALAQAAAQVGPRADLGPVIEWVLTGTGAPPSAQPPATVATPARARGGLSVQSAASSAASSAAAATRVSEVQRLPTSAMTPLPVRPVEGTPEVRPLTLSRSTGGRRGLDVTQQLEDSSWQPAEPPLGIESSAPTGRPVTRSGMTVAVVAAPRGFPVGLVAAALVVGLVAGFGIARATVKPTRSSADCAVPSTSMPAVQLSADSMKRAESAWRSGDSGAAAVAAKAANDAHGTPAAHMLLGRIALSGGNRVEALTHFRCVAALDPSGPSAAELEKLLNPR